MTTRRHVLTYLAVAPTALAASCDGALPDPVAAWRNPGAGETDLRRFALAHAILAPNPHNRQPWLVAMRDGDELKLFVDLDRRLPATDPLDRQITLGCGAFLELFDLAVREHGWRAEIDLWPEGEPQPRLDARPIAHLRITNEPAPKDALFAQITARRTNRQPYEARAVDEQLLTNVALDALPTADRQNLVVASAAGGQLRDALRQLAWNAFEKEFRTPAAHQETVKLTRIGHVEVAMERDGLSLNTPLIDFLHRIGVFNQRTFADINNPMTKQGLMAFRPLALDAPAFMWITSPDNSRTTQIAAGRAYARLNLAATAHGLAMHPWSQALQEYPEMAALSREAERLMDAPGDARVQMFVRVGYAKTSPPPAPRRGVEALFAQPAATPS